MKDPRRLIEEASLSDVERRSLSAALSDAPSPELVNDVWAGLGTAIGAGAAGTAAASAGHAGAKASAATLAGTGGKIAIIKALAVGAAVGAVTAGGAAALAPAHERPAATAHAPVPVAPRPAQRDPGRVEGATTPQAAPAPSAVPEAHGAGAPPPAVTTANAPPPASEESEEARAPGNPSPVAGFDATENARAAQPSNRADTEAAHAEARLVGEARDALRRRDAASALGVLADAERMFPDGILRQEREALTISALSDVGRLAEASARARAFLRAFPKSPHAERVRRALGER